MQNERKVFLPQKKVTSWVGLACVGNFLVPWTFQVQRDALFSRQNDNEGHMYLLCEKSLIGISFFPSGVYVPWLEIKQRQSWERLESLSSGRISSDQGVWVPASAGRGSNIHLAKRAPRPAGGAFQGRHLLECTKEPWEAQIYYPSFPGEEIMGVHMRCHCPALALSRVNTMEMKEHRKGLLGPTT